MLKILSHDTTDSLKMLAYNCYIERQNSDLICTNEEQRKVIEMLRTELTKKDDELLSSGTFKITFILVNLSQCD